MKIEKTQLKRKGNKTIEILSVEDEKVKFYEEIENNENTKNIRLYKADYSEQIPLLSMGFVKNEVVFINYNVKPMQFRNKKNVQEFLEVQIKAISLI
jgi:hypothetical protein